MLHPTNTFINLKLFLDFKLNWLMHEKCLYIFSLLFFNTASPNFCPKVNLMCTVDLILKCLTNFVKICEIDFYFAENTMGSFLNRPGVCWNKCHVKQNLNMNYLWETRFFFNRYRLAFDLDFIAGHMMCNFYFSL